MVKHLHKVLYIINLGLNEDFESHRPDFSQALEDNGIFNLLSKVFFKRKEKKNIKMQFIPMSVCDYITQHPSDYQIRRYDFNFLF